MERREFLRNTSLSVISLSLYRAGILNDYSLQKRRGKILVGVHVWPYAADLPGNDVSPVLGQIFSDAAYAGYSGVELKHHPLRSSVYTKQIGELIDQYRLILIGSSYQAEFWNKEKHNEIFEDIDRIFINMASVGGKVFSISVGQTRGRIKTEEEIDNQANLLRRIISLGGKDGIIINLHNHTYEVENNMYDLKGTLKRIPEIKLGPDLNWLLRAGINPEDFLKEFRKQIVYLHLRDQNSNGRWAESLGEGDIDFKEISDVLIGIDFKGVATVELAFEKDFVPTRPLKENLRMSREFVRKVMGI